MIDAMRSMRASFAESWAGLRRSISRRAWNRRSVGTWRIPSGRQPTLRPTVVAADWGETLVRRQEKQDWAARCRRGVRHDLARLARAALGSGRPGARRPAENTADRCQWTNRPRTVAIPAATGVRALHRPPAQRRSCGARTGPEPAVHHPSDLGSF